MNCPKCGSIYRCKDGIVKGSQMYKCKDCKYHYTVEQISNEKSRQTKRLAIEMYLEDMGLRAIWKMLKISHVTVFQWINQLGQTMELPKRQEGIAVVELDEMHTYVGQKKTIDGYGLLLIDME
ncbi:MAG: IS1 family transposase, partial [Prevotellaceae bacterium]|nr:IS1 family transposase [Prevotellaceae bacterium]